MELHSLKPAQGSTKKAKRIARGQGSGRGGTSTRGHKGAKSRSGYKRKRGFEGGQMPLQMRLPKRGFKSPNRQEYRVINIAELQAFADKYGISEINVDALLEKKYVRKQDKIKILGKGELKSKLKVKAHAHSAKAKEIIESQGGTIDLI